MNYEFAVNKSKLQTAITQLNDEKLRDISVEINEETVKARYIKLGGLLQDNAPIVEVPVMKKVEKNGFRKRS